MGAMGRYDITNDEQLRILTERLDALRAERKATDARIDQLVAEGTKVTLEWQTWRRGIEERLAVTTQAVAERMAHPLMDPQTVEDLREDQREMRKAQVQIATHLTVQDAAIADLRQDIAPFKRVTHTLETLNKQLRWVLFGFGGGALYEIGKLVTDRVFR